MSLKEAGAISGYDMTIEVRYFVLEWSTELSVSTQAAATKLAFLLGKNLPLREVKYQMGQDLRGELTPGRRTEEEQNSGSLRPRI